MKKILLMILGAWFGVLLFSWRGHAQENSGVDLAKKPCVTASSPCPLDFAAMPDAQMHQVMAAKRLFEDGDYAGAQKLLESLRAAQPESRTILFDLALVSLKQGQRDQAFIYQQQALRGVTHPYQRRVLDELAQEILYGHEVMDKTTLTLADVLDVPSAASKKGRVGSSRDPAERAETEIKTVCAVVEHKTSLEMESPNGVFNRAQCAEYEGRLDEADRLYKQYLEMAPEALDRDSVALRISEIDSFKDFDPYLPPRKTYHAGIRALMTGKFNAANAAFLALSSGGPGSRFGLLQAAMLALLSGRRPQAEKYLGSLLNQETNADMRDIVGQLLKMDDTRDDKFTSGIKEALKFSEESDFLQASEAIQAPLNISPLSPAVNALAGFIALNTNNYPAARRAMDNLWAQGQPVFFYGSVESSGQKYPLLYRVQMTSIKVVFVPVQAGGKITELVNRMQEDKPENAASIVGAQPVVEVAKSEITRFRSTGSGLGMETSKGWWKITPQVAFVKPREGWLARAFMNDYADLFSTYLGLANVELGAESANAADRWRMIGKIALAVLAAYAQGGGGYLSTMHGTAKMIVATSASASAAMTGVKQYRLYQATMNNTLNRFLFRPLIASGDTITFMVPEHSNQVSSTIDTFKPQTDNQFLVRYWTLALGKHSSSAGFAALYLDKDEIRLQDTAPGAPTLVVPCSVAVNSLFATETHTDSQNGKLSSSPSLTPSTIDSIYSLRIQRPTKEALEIMLEFGSELLRAEVRTMIESHCPGIFTRSVSVDLPVPARQQWKDFFHGRIKIYNRITIPFPSCAAISSLKIALVRDTNSEQERALLIVRIHKGGLIHMGSALDLVREILVPAGDELSALRIGSKLSADCGVPFMH